MMYLTVEDFPLTALGPLIYARRFSSPVLTACNDAVALVVCQSLNALAVEQRPGEVGGPWLVRH
jgi:hypothetical protein